MDSGTNKSFKLPVGVGGVTQEEALSKLSDMTHDVTGIGQHEHQARIERAQVYMQAHDVSALILPAGTSLTYFTGMEWYPSERLVAAILPAQGELIYIAPHFELGSIKDAMKISAPVALWQEQENPFLLVHQVLKNLNVADNATIAMEENAAFFIFDGIRSANNDYRIISGKDVTAHCRMHKSSNELALIQRAMDMTLEVHKAAASILKLGIGTDEVARFINKAHQKVGASGSTFCIVLFGVASSFPHGVKEPQMLQYGDVVLIDTGCRLKGYHSDITRTYVFGEANEFQRSMWQHEKNAQKAAFDVAQYGATCCDVDAAARDYLASVGLGPDYELPGCPHRTGHGLGMDIHEWPYLVKDNMCKLAKGMCFSNEPMLVVPEQFGIRLEDHFYMGEEGPVWFTQPSKSIDEPFG